MGGAKIAPLSTILLIQLALPFSLLINIVTIKSRYLIWHWVGSVIIIIGAVLITVSPILNSQSTLNDGEKKGVEINWYDERCYILIFQVMLTFCIVSGYVNSVIFMVGVVLSVVSSAVKELMIRDCAMSLSVVDFWM